MVRLYLILLFCIINNILLSQDINGFVFKGSEISSTKNFYKTDYLFQFSFKDGYLVYTVFDTNGMIEKSQFYSIRYYKIKELNSIYFVNIIVESGLPLSSQEFNFYINDDDSATLSIDGELMMIGKISELKTFKQ